jgi:hypothetical protein
LGAKLSHAHPHLAHLQANTQKDLRFRSTVTGESLPEGTVTIAGGAPAT